MNQTPDDMTSPPAAVADLSESERHRLLAAERRQTTLDVLAELSTPADVDDVAAAVAGREADGGAVDGATVERVALALHHAHLPKMDEVGVVDYDPVTTRVESALSRPDP